MKADRQLADTFDRVKGLSAFLIAQGIAEESPQQANVIA
jgi:hypothetical protein